MEGSQGAASCARDRGTACSPRLPHRARVDEQEHAVSVCAALILG